MILLLLCKLKYLPLSNSVILNLPHLQEELASLQEREERDRKEWREQFTKQETEARQQAERELRERLKRQRDKEIDRAIREIQAETAAREEDQRRNCDAKMK